MSEEVVETGSPVFTLVHGTWARETNWINEGSRLCRALRLCFPECVIERFVWSGANSGGARTEAAIRLRGVIEHTKTRYPASPQFIIAHSHGGTVAVEALRCTICASYVTGLVCLATPFVRFSKRKVAWIGDALYPMSALLGLGWMSMWVSVWLNRFMISRNVFWLVLSSLPVLFFRKLRNWQKVRLSGMADQCASLIDGAQEEVLSQYPSQMIDTPMLCIAVKRDEARLWLAWNAVLSSLFTITIGLLRRRGSVLRASWFGLLGIGIAGNLIGYAKGYHDPVGIGAGAFFILAAVQAPYGLAMLVLILVAVGISFAEYVRRGPWGLGIKGIPDVLIRTEINAVLSNAVDCQECMFSPRELASESGSAGLRHSLVYAADPCIITITDWIDRHLPAAKASTFNKSQQCSTSGPQRI